MNEMTTTTGTDLMTINPDDMNDVLSSDITIPRIILMQAMSELVADRKATPGDIVRTSTGEKVGDPAAPVSIIPLKFNSAWRLSEKVNGKFEWRNEEPRTAGNDKLPWEFQQHGTDWKREKVINLYALLVKDVIRFNEEMQSLGAGEMPDLNSSLLPVSISFRSTSFSAGGKALATFYAQVKEAISRGIKAKPHGYSIDLGAESHKNDKGNYYVFTCKNIRKLDLKMPELMAEAERWANVLNMTAAIKVEGEPASGARNLTDVPPF